MTGGFEIRVLDGDLVDTTVDSSAVGVELSTDDCRQPAVITDENSLWREPIFGGEIFF